MARKLKSDRWLFIAALFLVCVSVVMVYSALSGRALDAVAVSTHIVMRQLTWALLGFLLMLVVMRIDYRSWQQPGVVKAGLCAVFGALVLLAILKATGHGHVVKGAVRWIGFGGVTVQPSEFAKLAVVLFVADRLSRHMERVNDLRAVLLPIAAVIGGMAALILYQPDLGTTVSIVLVASAMLFAAGLSLQHIGALALVAFPALYLLVWTSPYRWARVTAFLDPWADPLGTGFQVIQSLIAVGTGGLMGRGLMDGLQKMRFLPEPHSDFIYAVIAEEFGLFGALVVLACFLLVAWRGFRVAMHAQDRFGSLLAVGLTTMIAVQALINISVVLGLVPTKGLPLPFVSAGGSSMLVSLIGIGILLNVSQHATVEA
jgi:cell division protein FtsW